MWDCDLERVPLGLRSFAEHKQMRDLMAQRKFDEAHALLEEHILIINHSISLPSENSNERTKGIRRSDEEYLALLSDAM